MKGNIIVASIPSTIYCPIFQTDYYLSTYIYWNFQITHYPLTAIYTGCFRRNSKFSGGSSMDYSE